MRIQAEMDRKRQEEDEKKRQEFERVKREQDEKFRKEEEARLAQEQIDMQPWLNSWVSEMIRIQAENHKRDDWNKYLLCDPMPDPYEEKQLTSYITLMSEKQVTDLEETLNLAQEAESIVKSMNKCYGETLEEYDTNKRTWCQAYISTLRSLSRRKIDEITARTMQYADDHLYKPLDFLSSTNPNKSVAKAALDPTPSKETFIKLLRPDIKMGLWINHQNTGHKFKPIDFEELNLNADMPRQYADDPCIMRVLWTSYDHISASVNTNYLVLGGTYEVALYPFPEMPKRVKKWTMRAIKSIEEMLVPKSYPPQDMMSNWSYANVNPLRMSYQLPEYIYLPNPDYAKVCWWDGNNWTDAEVSDVNIEDKQISFKIKKIAPIALVIPRTTDYPYNYWYLRAVAQDKVLLDIEGKRMKITFAITPGKMELVGNLAIPEVQHLKEKPMQPGILLLELAKSGVNLLPEDRDFDSAGLAPRSMEAEELAIFGISSLILAFAFRSTRWNKKMPGQIVAARMRENLEYDAFFAEDEEHDWRTVAWHANKCSLVNVKESATDLDLSIPQGHSTHFLLYLTVKDHCTEAAQTRMDRVRNVELSDTVKKCLRLLRLLTFY
jgi:hypothetical protein